MTKPAVLPYPRHFLLDVGFKEGLDKRSPFAPDAIGGVMKPHFLRAVLMILIVRAIFISPVNGSECGSTRHPGDPSLKRLDAIRPTRLRFTKPCPPSALQKRIDCLDGGDDDERTSLAEALADARFWVISPYAHLSHQLTLVPTSRSMVRLRC